MYKNEIYNEEDLEELLRLNEKSKELKLDALVYLCNTGKDIYEKMEDGFYFDAKLHILNDNDIKRGLKSYNTNWFLWYCEYGDYCCKNELWIKSNIKRLIKNQTSFIQAYNNTDIKNTINSYYFFDMKKHIVENEINVDEIIQQDFINYCNTGYYRLTENQKKTLLKLKE